MKHRAVLTKEIDLIQACINRMAQNSFMVKGWLITLYAAIFVVVPLRFDYRIPSFVAMLTVLCFWYLDGFFLKIETLYRWKYNWVIENRLSSNDHFFDLNPHNTKMWRTNAGETPGSEPSVLSKMCSRTLCPMYLLLFVVALLAFINTFTGWIVPFQNT